jgi:hypothetical protein
LDGNGNPIDVNGNNVIDIANDIEVLFIKENDSSVNEMHEILYDY